MTFVHRFGLAILLASTSLVPAFAQDASPWGRLSSNALNPKISAIADLLFQAGPGQRNSLAVRETEIALQADVDPYARADIFFALPNDEPFELEEGFVTLTALPWGLQARGGKIRPVFGRLNVVHSHERPQVDAPAVLDAFLGEEGLRSTGAEISRLFTPAGTFTELTYAFLNDLGEEESEATVTTEITDNAGNVVAIPVAVERPESAHRTIRDYAHAGRLRVFRDLSDAWNAEVGVSGAVHEPELGDRRRLGALDLTVRWKPEREGLYRSVTWRTEALASKRRFAGLVSPLDGSELTPAFETRRFGGYSYLEAQTGRRWRVGVRGDYVEDPGAASVEVTRGFVPYVTFNPSEFQRVRVQYRFRDLPGGRQDHTAYTQWTVIVGPHGGHAY